MKLLFEIEIPGLPKTPNTMLGKHWRSRSSHAKKWQKAVALYTNQFKPAKPLASAVLTLTRLSSVEPDADGLVGSFKPVIDGLVTNGIIADDKMSNIGMPAFLWEKTSPGKGRIRIKVEALTSVKDTP